MANDDEKPHDWDPERERAQVDPDKLARTWVRAAADEAAKIDQEAQARAAKLRELKGEGLRPVVHYAVPPAALQLAVRKITNGYMVTYGLVPVGYPADQSCLQEAFAADSTEVHAVVLRLLREFFEGKLAKPGYGTPPGPFIGGVGPVEG